MIDKLSKYSFVSHKNFVMFQQDPWRAVEYGGISEQAIGLDGQELLQCLIDDQDIDRSVVAEHVSFLFENPDKAGSAYVHRLTERAKIESVGIVALVQHGTGCMMACNGNNSLLFDTEKIAMVANFQPSAVCGIMLSDGTNCTEEVPAMIRRLKAEDERWYYPAIQTLELLMFMWQDARNTFVFTITIDGEEIEKEITVCDITPQTAMKLQSDKNIELKSISYRNEQTARGGFRAPIKERMLNLFDHDKPPDALMPEKFWNLICHCELDQGSLSGYMKDIGIYHE